MADIADLERRVEALEKAHNTNTGTLKWISGTLGQTAADVSALREDLPKLITESMRDVQKALKTELTNQFTKHDDLMDKKFDALRNDIQEMLKGRESK